MSKKPAGPDVTTRVIGLSQKHFATTGDAREAIRKAIDAIPDAQLHNVRGIQVLLMA